MGWPSCRRRSLRVLNAYNVHCYPGKRDARQPAQARRREPVAWRTGSLCSGLLQERVGLALCADPCRWAVARKHRYVVAERKQFFSDPLQQQIDIATWQVASPDAAGEKNIAADEQLVLARKKAKAAGAMSWNFEHLHFQAEKFSRRRLFDEEVRFDRLNFQLKSQAAKKIRIGNHLRGFWMAADLAMKAAFDFSHVGNVIEMAMRQQQKL